MILTIVILGVLLLTSIGVNVYFGAMLNRSIDKNEQYEQWISDIENAINITYNKLKLIDDKQMFEKDDDVGFVFSNIVKLIEKLKSQL
jgi:hypothetical protein